MTENYKSGVLNLLITVVGWGLLYPASKDIVMSGIDGYYVTAIRYGIGCLFVASLLLLSEGPKAFSYEGNVRGLWLLGTVGFGGLNFFTFLGVTYSSAEHGTIILALLPMMGMMLSWLTDGYAPSRLQITCILTAFFGVVIMITGLKYSVVKDMSLFGDLLLVAGTASWAIYTFYIKRYAQWSALRATSLSSRLGAASILASTGVASIAGIAHKPLLFQVAAVWPQFAILVLTTAVIVTWNAGIRALGAANGMLFVNLVPVVTFVIGYWRGHPVSGTEIAGGMITLSALVGNNLLSRRRSSSL